MNKDPGIGGDISLDQKKEILYQSMDEFRPTFKDFRGHPGYINESIQKHQNELNKKEKKREYYEKILADDEFARYMEPVVTCVLNDSNLFPTRNNFSFPASKYDDEINGTDIVFVIGDRTGKGSLIFSIDAASGTNIQNIQEKFERSAIYNYTSHIEYCLYKDQRWRESDAPHFILGISPGSQNKAMDNIIIKDLKFKERTEDLDTDFMILSEMKEQIRMQMEILGKESKSTDHLKKLNVLAPAVTMALCRTLGIDRTKYSSDEECLQAFRESYSQKSEECKRRDDVYRNIMLITKHIREKGVMTLRAIKATA